jgi:hypothetical protein
VDRSQPRKITTLLEKRKPGATEPYEVDERTSYYEADGTEATDPARIMEIEAELFLEQHEEQQ